MIKKYFGTDGIRGKVNGSKINGEMFFKFGLAAGTYFKNLKKSKQTAIIAKDINPKKEWDRIKFILKILKNKKKFCFIRY